MRSAIITEAHALVIDDLAARLGTDTDVGLADEEAAERLAIDGPNVVGGQAGATWLQRLLRQFSDPLVLLLLAAIVISLLAWYFEEDAGWPVDAIVITAIVVTNALLGALQEHRADQAVQALADMTAGTATVTRSGRTQSISIADVVVGDLLTVHEGDVVAADARVIDSAALLVAEAALTGESVPVRKDTARVDPAATVADRTCMVHAGTAAVSGHGRGVVTATGMSTEVGQIADMLVSTEQLPTPLEREIGLVSRFLGIAVLVITAVIAVVIAVSSTLDSVSDVVEVLLLAVSIAVAAVPEGLPAVLSIVLAIGVSRMARRNALVKRLASAETLGAATVICTDKTGTLTRNEMQVRAIAVPDGELTLPSEIGPGPLRDAVEHLMLAAAAASNVEIAATSDHEEISGDPTETSLVQAGLDIGLTPARLQHVTRLGELPFDADRRRMSVLVTGLATPGSEQSDDVRTVVVKGAPEVMLERCGTQLTAAGPTPLDRQARERWEHETTRFAGQAMRTLLIASRHADDGFELAEDNESELTLLGLVGIMDPPRDEAAAAIATAQQAGIQVTMLTGDHPNTGFAIAKALGITGDDGRAITGAELDQVDDDELAELLETNSVFARVAPAHKLRMVQVLQRGDHVVAMTGDGVNDAPALKAADIGTAMGLNGTDVAREAADMVLTDDNFATIIEAVRAGRTIFRNVRSFLRYLLSSNVGEVLTIFFGVVFAGAIGLTGDGVDVIAPLTAVQILWINLLTDTGPAFALGLDPADGRAMQYPPRRPGDRVIDAKMQRGIGVVGLTMAAATLITFDAKRPDGLIDGNSSLATAQTAAFTVLVLAQLFNCFSARSDSESAFVRWARNPLLLVAVLVSLLLQVAVVHLPFLQRGFGTTSLSLSDWLLATLVASSVLVTSEVRKLIERFFTTDRTPRP